MADFQQNKLDLIRICSSFLEQFQNNNLSVMDFPSIENSGSRSKLDVSTKTTVILTREEQPYVEIEYM